MLLHAGIQTVLLVANKNELAFDTADDSIFIYEIGIGKVNALVAIAKLHQQIQELGIHPILVNVGTVGSTRYPIGHALYPEAFAQGDAYTADFFLENTNFLVGKGMIKAVDINDFDHTNSLLTSDRFINTNTAFYKDIAHLNALAYDMEGYALAYYCHVHQLPFYAIKIVSDNCDGTVKDWENILAKISATLGDIVQNYLDNLRVEKTIS